MENKKNVLLLVPMLDQGGLERVCAQTAVLLKYECNVTVVVFNGKNRIYDLEDVELIDFRLASRKGVLGKIFNLRRRIFMTRRIKKQKKIDIAYSFGNTANLVNVLSRCGDFIWIGIRGYGALTEKRVFQLTCKKADRVVCCTKIMADEVAQMFPDKSVITLYNPCDIRSITELSDKEPLLLPSFFREHKKIVAAMGRMHDVKGFWHILKAFALLQKDVPGAGLMLIGDGDSSEYQKLAEDLGIEDNVLFLGVQRNPFQYLKYASLYLLTSANEGFPNALIEAMALGVVPLAVNCKTGPAEILLKDYRKAGDDGKVYEADFGVLLPVMNPVKNLNAASLDEEEGILAREVGRLLSDGETREAYRKMAVKRAGDFSPESYRKELLLYINEE